MADKEGLPRVERKRGPMGDGRPTNAKELAAVLERDRAKLVLLYRANPRAWPDGIDPKGGEAWYGDGSAWTDERIKAATDGSLFDPAVERGKPRAKPRVVTEGGVKLGRPPTAAKGDTLTAKEPWKAQGISRSAWYAKNKGGNG